MLVVWLWHCGPAQTKAAEIAGPQAVEIVKLRLFAGLSVAEAADALGLARATAYLHWTFARAWLRCELGEEPPAE